MTTPGLTPFNPKEWRYHGYWKQSLFAAYFWHSCFDEERVQKLGLPITEIGYLMFKEGYYLASQEVYDQLAACVQKTVSSGDFAIWEALRRDAEHVHDDIAQHIQTPVQTLTSENWQQALTLANADTLYWGLAAAYLCPIADQLLQDAVRDAGLEPTLLAQIIPAMDTPLMAQRKELAELRALFIAKDLPITAASVAQDSELATRINEHLKRYAWIEFASWVGSPLTLDRLLALITSLEIADESKRDTSNLPLPVQHALRFFAIAGYVRQSGGEYFMQLSFHYQGALAGYAEEVGVSYTELLRLSPNEVLLGLQKNLSPEQLRARISERGDGKWITFTHDGAPFIVHNVNDVQELIDKMVPAANNETEVITGQVGNRGMARGVVRVILNVDTFHTFNPGEILVSSMTTPDFVILMQQAAAIVTDQGGLLCHAAIVSREMNKPCVIGTKIATKVLKDGDVVEVDATQGVVTVLNKT